MAEALTHKLKGDLFCAFSAGTAPKGIDPNAIDVLLELGIDISGNISKSVDEVAEIQFDYVVTLCGHANETCPFFPRGTKRLHRGFDDPPKLSEGETDKSVILSHYRRIRDEIRSFVENMPGSLEA